jgi:hypothetical protein
MPSPEIAKLYSEPPVIELVTMGIGSLIWERHGHIALCVTQRGVTYSLRHLDPENDRCYNYGIGDFTHALKMTWGFFHGTQSFRHERRAAHDERGERRHPAEALACEIAERLAVAVAHLAAHHRHRDGPQH